MNPKTLKEIAKELKVSRFTIARVLRDEKYVSEKTRNLILNYLKKNPYVPNIHSTILSSGKVNILGLVFFGDASVLTEFYTQEIIKGTSEAAKNEGYQLMLFTQDKFDSFECLKLYMSRLVAGLILPGVGKNNFKDVLGLKHKKVPLVLVCSHLNDISSFACDNVRGGYLATKHLLDSGRKRIAYLSGRKNWVDAVDRFKGYKKALKEKGKNIIEEYVQWDDGHGNYEEKAIKNLLALKEPPDAIFVANDRMALAAMSIIKQAGKNIPQDIAVIGFDNMPSCENFSPPLSTVAQPIKDIAFVATKSLIKIISSGKDKDYTRFFKPELVIRQSG